MGFPGGTSGKQTNERTFLPMKETEETWVLSLGREYPLEEEMATHFSILAWKIPWAEEPGGLQRVGLHRVEHNCVPHAYIYIYYKVYPFKMYSSVVLVHLQNV